VQRTVEAKRRAAVQSANEATERRERYEREKILASRRKPFLKVANSSTRSLDDGDGVDPVSPDMRRLGLGTEPDELAGRSELQT